MAPVGAGQGDARLQVVKGEVRDVDALQALLQRSERDLLDRLLEDDAIFCRIKADMARRRPHSLTLGRPGTPVEVVLRLLVLKRLHGWSYEEVERFVADSLVLRQFCRIYLEKVR